MPQPAPHYLNLTAEGAHDGIDMADHPLNGFESQNSAFTGPNLKIVTAASCGLVMPNRTKAMRFALRQNEASAQVGGTRYIIAISTHDPLIRNDLVYYAPAGIGTRSFGWVFHGDEYWYTLAACIFDHSVDAFDDARGGWDYNAGTPGIGQPFLRFKFFEPTHTDKYIDGAVGGYGNPAGLFNNHGHNNNGLSVAFQLNSNPGSNPQFSVRPGGSAQSSDWRAAGFQPALTDKTAYWAVNWGGGEVSQNNNTATWAGRPIIPNEWVYFKWRYKSQNTDGVVDTTQGISDCWMFTKAELDAGILATSPAPLISYRGSTNQYIANTPIFIYDTPDDLNGQYTGGARLLQRPCFQLPGMLYFVSGSPPSGPQHIYNSLAEQWISNAGADTALSSAVAPPTGHTPITFSGQRGLGNVLTASQALTPGNYVWQAADSIQGANLVAISGQVSRTYTESAPYHTKYIRVGYKAL